MKRVAARFLYTSESIEPIHNGFVEYDDDGIVICIGTSPDINEESLYYDGAIVPGFINAHCHVELSHLLGKFSRGSGMAGFIDQINDLRDSAGREQKIECIRCWMDRLWSHGVSAMADISNCEDSFAVKSGSRIYTRTFLEVFGTEPEDCAGVMSSVRRLKDVAGRYGIDAAPTPHSCYTMSPELLSASAADALDEGYLSFHSQESMQEELFISEGTGELADNRRHYGMSMPESTGKPSLMYFIDRLLDVHPAPFDEHILLVHNVCLSQEAIDAAAAVFKNAYYAICPLSNMFIHNTLPPVMLMRENGLNITIGTDSLSSNDNLDMVGEMYCLQEAFPDVPFGEILSWACINGAAYLSKEGELGSISAGKRPGLVFIDGIDEDGRLTSASRSVRIV